MPTHSRALFARQTCLPDRLNAKQTSASILGAAVGKATPWRRMERSGRYRQLVKVSPSGIGTLVYPVPRAVVRVVSALLCAWSPHCCARGLRTVVRVVSDPALATTEGLTSAAPTRDFGDLRSDVTTRSETCAEPKIDLRRTKDRPAPNQSRPAPNQ